MNITQAKSYSGPRSVRRQNQKARELYTHWKTFKPLGETHLLRASKQNLFMPSTSSPLYAPIGKTSIHHHSSTICLVNPPHFGSWYLALFLLLFGVLGVLDAEATGGGATPLRRV